VIRHITSVTSTDASNVTQIVNVTNNFLSAANGTRTDYAPDTLRAIRAIQVLELIGTREARARIPRR